jgi:hypothetical protein
MSNAPEDDILASLDFDESYSDVVQSSLFYIGANLSILEEALFCLYERDTFRSMVLISSLTALDEPKLELFSCFALSSFFAMANDYFGLEDEQSSLNFFLESNIEIWDTVPVTEYAWQVLKNEVFISVETANAQMTSVISVFFETSSLSNQLLFIIQACKLSNLLLSKMYVFRNKMFDTKIPYLDFLSEVMLRLREAHSAPIVGED